MTKALSGIRICDFSGQLAGAGATRFLAAMGAEVIRIEDPVTHGYWDVLRGVSPFIDERRGADLGGPFNNHNVEKLGVTLNLRTDAGKNLLRGLLSVSDVVTENFSAGVFARFGFSYEEIRTIKEDIVYVSNSGFGHRGPYRDFKTWGPLAQACCGLAFATGLSGQHPAGIGYSYMDHHGANMMTIAIMTGLLHRQRSGEGQWIDVSCTDAGALLNGPSILDYTVNNRSMRRLSSPDSNRSESPAMAPHGIYPTAGDDNWIAISCRGDAEWVVMAGFIATEWSNNAKWQELIRRIEFQDELDELIGTWTRSFDRFALATELRSLGVPASAVQRPNERIDEDPTTEDWGLWPEVTHSKMGDVRVDGIPLHFSKTDWTMRQGGPCLGEHNQEVFCDLLGHSEDELRLWQEGGVV